MAVLVKGLMVCGRHRAQKKRTGHLRKQTNYIIENKPRWQPPTLELDVNLVSPFKSGLQRRAGHIMLSNIHEPGQLNP